MSSDVKRVGDSGIYTAEGMTAGGRAARLAAQREKEKAEFEAKKRTIEGEKALGSLKEISSKFKRKSNKGEIEFKTSTVGLKTASEYRKALDVADNESKSKKQEAMTEKAIQQAKAARKRKRKSKQKKSAKMLSFADDEEEEEEEVVIVKKKSKTLKDPTVETDFLPDRDRERAQKKEVEKLQNEWKKEQQAVKKEKLEVVYSFWDGSGHRRTIQIEKGATIGKFLELVRKNLVSEFPELRGTHGENLMYIKEDLIIPHHYTFYYLILTKARGKSGPLFHFDVHDDVRMMNNASIEKDESHPGKICERAWYERNKHIFPASRWEIFDPNVKRDKYTVGGGVVRGPEAEKKK